MKTIKYQYVNSKSSMLYITYNRAVLIFNNTNSNSIGYIYITFIINNLIINNLQKNKYRTFVELCISYIELFAKMLLFRKNIVYLQCDSVNMKNLSPLSVALPYAHPELTGSPLQSSGAFYMSELVYFFKHNNIDAVKIGLTKSDCIKRRFVVFSTYSPFGAEIIGYIKTENSAELEKIIHTKFKDNRIYKKSEWFTISKNQAIQIIDFYNGVVCDREIKPTVKTKVYTIINMYKSGIKQVNIAKELNTYPSYVSKVLRIYNQ